MPDEPEIFPQRRPGPLASRTMRGTDLLDPRRTFDPILDIQTDSDDSRRASFRQNHRSTDEEPDGEISAPRRPFLSGGSPPRRCGLPQIAGSARKPISDGPGGPDPQTTGSKWAAGPSSSLLANTYQTQGSAGCPGDRSINCEGESEKSCTTCWLSLAIAANNASDGTLLAGSPPAYSGAVRLRICRTEREA